MSVNQAMLIKELIVQRHALESGVTRVNGVTAWPGLILKDGDRLE